MLSQVVSLANHKPGGPPSPPAARAATVCPVKSAGAVSGHLARLLLLVCTVLGVAALHTVGHAALAGQGREHPATAAAVAAVVPGDLGGCDGDGCPHHAAGPGGAADTSRWWDVCVAVLGALAAGALAVRLWARARGASPVVSAPARWRPPPRSGRASTAGLIVTSMVVLRT